MRTRTQARTSNNTAKQIALVGGPKRVADLFVLAAVTEDIGARADFYRQYVPKDLEQREMWEENGKICRKPMRKIRFDVDILLAMWYTISNYCGEGIIMPFFHDHPTA